MSLIITYDQELNIKLRFLRFNINIFLRNALCKNKPSKNGDDNISISNFIKKDSIINTVKYIYGALKLLSGITRKILKRTTIKSLTLDYSITGHDSFETAIKYGQSCTLIYTILGIIDSINSPKHLEVNVYPNYNASQSSFKFNLHICARSFFIIYSIFFFTVKYIKNQKEEINGKQQ
jgi:hypothetical protein